MAKNTQKNQLECNKKARKTYTDKNFKYQTVCFKIEEIEDIYDKLDIGTINIFHTLDRHNKEREMFYKTDHHWTSYGAYYSYLEFCKFNKYGAKSS